MKTIQKTFRLKPRRRGFHLITEEIENYFPELKSFQSGTANIFIQHTSAGLTINENADPMVRQDFETFFTGFVPEDTKLYKHTTEGVDDMTSHIKSTIVGSNIAVPITDGRFNLGIWQGIYLCEFRDRLQSRTIVVTIIGETNE